MFIWFDLYVDALGLKEYVIVITYFVIAHLCDYIHHVSTISQIYESTVAYIPIYKRTIMFIEIMLMYTLLRTCSQSKQYSLDNA
jgi:hypothetical protein